MSSRFGVGGVGFRIGTEVEKYVDTVAFGAYTRELIDKAGELDEELVRNQDDEYNYRARKQGARILLSPEIGCRYTSRSSLKRLWRQYFEYGVWKVRVAQKHPGQMRLRHFVPASFVLALGISALAAVFSTPGRIGFVALLSLYVLANLLASVTAGSNFRTMVRLPAAFAVLHFLVGSCRT
jgi:hypothetical protein